MEENQNRNFFVAIALSIAVLIGWQFLYAEPRLREAQQRQEAIQAAEQARNATAQGGTTQPGSSVPAPTTGAIPIPQTDGAPTPGTGAASHAAQSAGSATPGALPAAIALPREAVLAQGNRIPIETAGIRGSINLIGGRIDDIVLKRYRQTVEPNSPNVVLFSPKGAPDPFYAEYGWVGVAGSGVALPAPDTEWRVEGNAKLTDGAPVTLVWDNGGGVEFRRTISIDNDYMFTIRQEVNNSTGAPLTVHPYGLISRHSEPETQAMWVLHEGMVGVLGDEGLQEITYDDALEEQIKPYKNVKQGWLGITDKYFAAVLVPDQAVTYDARFVGNQSTGKPLYQADYLLPPQVIPANASASVTAHMFAGAKRVELIDSYEEKLGIKQFELLIDWGWFYYITKLLFKTLNWVYGLVGNFGVAILGVTVLIKLIFFPLANKSYVSMSKMKKLQPEMQRIQERYKDDRVRQQQAMMELYKTEKVNPMSGCLPILVQIPVFFALYKVLFVTIEMRHAPFFGWIRDLSAKDPTSLFNLFGLLPFSVPDFLVIGVLPLIMGITMWVQMRLNPAPTDPVQQKIFAWMPLFFTILLAPFAAGLVLYWTWNNILSIAQQWLIMQRQGVKVELIDNLKDSLSWIPGLESWKVHRPDEAKAPVSKDKSEHANGRANGFTEAELDAFEVLGLKPGASSSQIETAYRKAIKKHHPDASGDDGALAARLNEAKAVLLARGASSAES